MSNDILYLIYGIPIDEDFLDEDDSLEPVFDDIITTCYDGNSYIGIEIWNSSDCMFSDSEVDPSSLPSLTVTEEQKNQVDNLICEAEAILGVELGSPGFYWRYGST
jgi:hypothetical protein